MTNAVTMMWCDATRASQNDRQVFRSLHLQMQVNRICNKARLEGSLAGIIRTEARATLTRYLLTKGAFPCAFLHSTYMDVKTALLITASRNVYRRL